MYHTGLARHSTEHKAEAKAGGMYDDVYTAYRTMRVIGTKEAT